ncbi:MAG: hypothetical protein KTR15_03120 [Phycisphaeraceae bacterium]|nr:hypothetical protein [Phycisphaeraceae bacterium]
MPNEDTAMTNHPGPGNADAVVGGALGWLFLLVGCAAITAAALIPAYFETLDVKQAREIEAIKAQMLADERQRYINFHQALIDDDPVLIERLAMTELRLKPVGTEVAQHAASDPLALVVEPTEVAIQQALSSQSQMRSIENELSRPDLKQQAVIDVQLERPRQTRLIIAATGEYRPILAGAGAVLVLMGLWPRRAPQ